MSRTESVPAVAVAHRYKHLLERGTVSEPDLNKLKHFRDQLDGAGDKSPDELLLRFLRAYSYDTHEAVKGFKALKECLTKDGIPEVSDEAFYAEMNKGLFVYAGKTPNGSPIFFVPIHLHDPNKTELGAWLKSLLRTMDIFFVKHDAWHIGVTLVIDCSKVGMAQLKVDFDRAVINWAMHCEFERFMTKIYICDGGFTMGMVLKVLKPLMYRRLAEKLENSTMKQLKKEWGANCLDKSGDLVEMIKAQDQSHWWM